MEEARKKALQYKYAAYLFWLGGVGGTIALAVFLVVYGLPVTSEDKWLYVEFLSALAYGYGGGVFMWKKYKQLQGG